MSEASLYIPCFNAANTVQFCLEAVLKQSYPLKEVLLVDDGSTDESVKIASRYPVRLMRHENNWGLAATRNIAIRSLKTKFIASLDADCFPESDWLEHLMKRFDSSKVAGVGGRLLENYFSTVFDLWRSVHMKQYWESEDISPNFLFGSNVIFRRDILINIGLYNEDLKNNYEDVDISARLKKEGFILVYEPKAIVHHLKNDDISSILNTYWRWNFRYYKEEGFYSSKESFIFKLKDNAGLANRYLEEDIAQGRYQLLYLDFLLALHHSLRDFEYFISQDNKDNKEKAHNGVYPFLSYWVALLDLTFFYHLDSAKKKLSTLTPKTSAFLQNFFALNLILGKLIKDKFKTNEFKKTLYKHLFQSVYKIDDDHLMEKLLNLIEFHQDWSMLLKKAQPNINAVFLENLFSNLKSWIEDLEFRFPDIIQMIEVSAKKTERLSLCVKEEVRR